MYIPRCLTSGLYSNVQPFSFAAFATRTSFWRTVNMEPLSPTHPTFHTYTAIDAQKAINRETSIVQVPTVTAAQQQPPSNVEHNDGAPGDPEVAPASTALRTYGEVQPSPSRASLPPRAPSLSSPQQPTQLYSPTQTEIDSHPIRQRLSVHGDHVAASGWGTRIEEKGSSSLGETRQDDRDTEQGSEREIAGKMTEVKEGDKGMFCALRLA